MPRRLRLHVERWPIAGSFTIARGSKTEAVVVMVELEEAGCHGRGECVPYARYGESVEGVVAAIEALRAAIEAGLPRGALEQHLPPGAARNALDCALWDLEAKQAGRSVHELLALPPPRPLVTAYTLSLATPDEMGRAARAAAHRPLIKIKLGGTEDDLARLAAVRAGAPKSALIVDANEGWSEASFAQNMAACASADVKLIEQPLPTGNDELLAHMPHLVPVCADESAHDRAGLAALAGKYDAINIKLDKTGGLTEALALADAAETAGLRLMVGCMLATSLAMAPAVLVAQRAAFVDLDGPLLLAKDRVPGLRYDGSLLHPPAPELWG